MSSRAAHHWSGGRADCKKKNITYLHQMKLFFLVFLFKPINYRILYAVFLFKIDYLSQTALPTNYECFLSYPITVV